MDSRTEQAELESIPALLQRNANRFADRHAYREKEYGIWPPPDRP